MLGLPPAAQSLQAEERSAEKAKTVSFGPDMVSSDAPPSDAACF